MKRTICLILSLLMSFLLVLPAGAASEEPIITLQPQSPNYPEYSQAVYTVKAEGTNLTATWYMDWMGQTHNLSETGGSMQSWEHFAGETYGPLEPEQNTFVFFFGGIEYDLDGAYIWCVIEDGQHTVTSQKNRISVGNENDPPEILEFPSAITVEQGEEAIIRCVAVSADESALSYRWYETETGHRNDIAAVNEGTETKDHLMCDTSAVGTRNYICAVESANGGLTYSSTVSVTVGEKKTEPTEPSVPTEPTSPSSQAPNADSPPDGAQKNGFPWWGVLLIAVAACGIGFGVTSFFLKKKA